MKGALANEAHVGSAECAVTQDRCTDAMPGTERTFAEILADVLRVERLSVDSNFFEELGADSLVMAKFYARASTSSAARCKRSSTSGIRTSPCSRPSRAING